MRALNCTNCGAALSVDETKNSEYTFCSFCGTKIMLHEVIEHRHSGTVSIEGMANNERRIALLFDYIAGMKNINFYITANQVLMNEDDPRVYLAYLLLDPIKNISYLSKYIRMVPIPNEFELSVQKRFPSKYYAAFCNNEKRLMYMFEHNMIRSVNPNLLRHCIHLDFSVVVDYLLSNGVITPNSKYSFNNPNLVGLANDRDAQKYGLQVEIVSGHGMTKRTVKKPGELTVYQLAVLLGSRRCIDVFKKYIPDDVAVVSPSTKQKNSSMILILALVILGIAISGFIFFVALNSNKEPENFNKIETTLNDSND